jgi:class 3 adenylate cyclase
MAKLSDRERAELPDRAFAYIDSKGRRRLPIHDEAHVRNALARFNQVRFETEAAREKARLRLLRAAKRFGIVPVGFIAGQLEAEGERVVRRRMADLPTGLITFLLTDIEGSTALLRHLGQRYGGLLAEVRGIIHSAVSEAGGHEVDTRADEFLGVFERAPAALEAAMAIQRTLFERTWPDEAQVRVRIGLHLGQATLTEGGYIGLAVHTVARITSVAHGGQILLSVDVKESQQGDHVGFLSLGSHHLAGLPEPIELFQVSGEGLISEFPPLRLPPG